MSIENQQFELSFSEKIKHILADCDRMDALVGYFYFSGFKELYKELKDKKIRILIGMDIDPKIVDAMSKVKSDVFIDEYTIAPKTKSRSVAKEDFFKNFTNIFNNSDLFDSGKEDEQAFKVFLYKIEEGTLEIKKTIEADHSKLYVFHHLPERSKGGMSPGMVAVGSSNLTISGLNYNKERNQILHEPHYYHENSQWFEKAWKDPNNITLADIETSKVFLDRIKKGIWLYSLPTPQLMYFKVLDEYFEIHTTDEFKLPSEITSGKYFDLQYQKDAIRMGIDRIERFKGVIISDVVGLGKSIIASAIAHNLNRKTVIICPPHLEDQWNDYMDQFDFKGFVYTTGKVEEALNRHGESKELLIILDEAHKHRNEDTDSYKMLHKLCSSHYVMALSATPFNNDPKDIYALIKLFSTPGQSTIKTVENLSTSFHDLFKRYKKIRKNLRKTKQSAPEESQRNSEIKQIADELRKMIEPLVVRRSRLDLNEIDDYRNDLQRQEISFPKVNDPDLLEYDLGNVKSIYIDTLDKIAVKKNYNNDEDEEESQNQTDQTFIGARYKVASYIRPGSKVLHKIIEDDLEDDSSPEEKLQQLQQAQKNISKFMRWLLVRRFESSIGAFKLSLEKMIQSSETMLSWYEVQKIVPIYKEGDLPNANELQDMSGDEAQKELDYLESKGLISIPIEEIEPNFVRDLKFDIEHLKKIQNQWKTIEYDPKFLFFESKIKTLLKENPKRKIVVFTELSDTAEYVYNKLTKSRHTRIFKYSSKDSSKQNKDIIKTNFDAGLDEEKQANDFDIIIATDAISEGYNLHRAGVIINYDIPYNPTKVIQRVGRINRINKQVFDELFIYNFFPSITGEEETATKSISTLKISLIQALLGDDVKTLTSEEELKSFYAKEFKEKNKENEQMSWDASHRNAWLNLKKDTELHQQVKNIPHRCRIARKTGHKGVVTFAKRGGNFIFAYGDNPNQVDLITPEQALSYFKPSDEQEEAIPTSANFEPIYKVAKDKLFKNNTQPMIQKGRKMDGLAKLEILSKLDPDSVDLCKDLIIIIKDYDALPNGLLKEIAQFKIDKKNPQKTTTKLRELFPLEYIEKINTTANYGEDQQHLVVLSEEFI
jgi:superfamily II DNA or RNA helicase